MLAIACGGGAHAPSAGSPDAGVDARRLDGGSDALGADGDALRDAAPDAEGASDAASEADAADAPAVYGGNCGDASPETAAPTGACNVTVTSYPDEGHDHVPVGSTVVYCTNPPNSGPHYPIWAHYRSYDVQLPWPYLVHDLEHGAVLLLYKCAGSCPDVVAQLQAIIDARPVDPLCDVEAGVSRRLILEPAADLDVPIAVVAWQWIYEASCVDAASINAFVEAHYAQAAENVCADGYYP